MQITIHRATQIGGQITRISTAQASIIIDLGHNLPNHAEDKDVYDNDCAIAKITEGCSAILYTHYHGDHIGLFHHVPNNIPQYIGEVAKQVVYRKYKQLCFLRDLPLQQKYCHALTIASGMHTFHENQILHFGDISVTPYFVSHSAYDAYMFLIEAEGKRILHTGDFRGHGYLSKGLLPTIQKHIGQVDVLIIEGTMLARKDETILTERVLSQKAAELMKEHKYVFVHCSSTDMERLASFKNAARSMFPKRPLLADEFQKDILALYSETAGKKSACFDFGKIYTYSEKNSKLKAWMLKEGFTMFIRASASFNKLLDSIFPILPMEEKPLLIYSMWNGYKQQQSTQEFLDFAESLGIKVIDIHTSGHADRNDLHKFLARLNPQHIIPIHTVNTEWFIENYGDDKVVINKIFNV